MPRTKAVKKPRVDAAKEEQKQLFLQEIEEHFNRQKAVLKEVTDSMADELETYLREERLSIGRSTGNKTLAELRAGVSDATSVTCQSLLLNTLNSTKTAARHRSRTVRRSASVTEDEGYLTAGSNSSTRTRTTRRSRSQQPTQRVSRSVTRSKVSKNMYQTPASKGAPPMNFGTITPKMKPNTPQLVLRRPKAGEVAVSMQGSPLLVSGVVGDDVPNLNIPLGDGRTISIQPKRGLRPSLLPVLDDNTRKQIETLRDNLNKMCALSANLQRKE